MFKRKPSFCTYNLSEKGNIKINYALNYVCSQHAKFVGRVCLPAGSV